MAEHAYDGTEQVIGFAFDGTGYGSDEAVWGGEVLLANYKGYQRLAQLKYVPLAGGDVSVLRPYRMALAHMWAAGIPWDPDLPPVAACPPDELEVLAQALETGLGCVPTSSMGRLFDAVSSLVGVRQVVAYEAQAAIELEGMSRGIDCGATAYAFDIDRRTATALIDPRSRPARRGPRPRAGVPTGVDRGAVPPRGRRPDRRRRRLETGSIPHGRAVRWCLPECAAVPAGSERTAEQGRLRSSPTDSCRPTTVVSRLDS